MPREAWGFYGRKTELKQLAAILRRDRWFDGHVARFLRLMPRFASWRVEKVAVAPLLTSDQRAQARARGYRPQDLVDLTEGL